MVSLRPVVIYPPGRQPEATASEAAAIQNLGNLIEGLSEIRTLHYARLWDGDISR